MKTVKAVKARRPKRVNRLHLDLTPSEFKRIGELFLVVTKGGTDKELAAMKEILRICKYGL
jgi:hypothetical protein